VHQQRLLITGLLLLARLLAACTLCLRQVRLAHPLPVSALL